MEAINTSETSAYFYDTTRPNVPEGCGLQTRLPENLKSHSVNLYGEDNLSCVRKCEAPLNALMMVAVRTLEKSITSMRLHGAISQNAAIIKYLEDLHSARRSRLQSHFIAENRDDEGKKIRRDRKH
jgi:hypothetical protein